MRSRVTTSIRRVVRGRSSGRVRAVWRVLFPVLAVFLGLSLPAAAARAMGVSEGATMVAGFAAATLVVLGALWVSARFLDRRPVPEYGFRVSRAWWLDLVVGAGIGGLLVTTAFAISRRVGALTVADTGTLADGTSLAWLAVFAVAFAGVAFYEETVFRGLFVTNAAEGLAERGLSRRAAVAAAVVASTAAFSAVHLPSALAADASAGLVAAKTVAFGGLLGAAYVLTGELALPMGLHFGVNVTQTNLLGIGSSAMDGVPVVLGVESAAAGAWNPGHGVPMLAATVAAAAAVAAWSYVRRGGRSARLVGLGAEGRADR